MTFENKGPASVVIFNPTLGFGTGIKEIVSFAKQFDPETGSYKEVEYERRAAEVDPQTGDNLRSMVRFLDDDHPAENMTLTLEPGETFTFEESFSAKEPSVTVVASDRDEVNLARLWGSSQCFNRNGKHVCRRLPTFYRLVYEFSSLPFVEDPNLLDKLSTRWARYGRLPVGANGIYTITSEPIKAR